MTRIRIAIAVCVVVCVTVVAAASRADRAPDPVAGRAIYTAGAGTSGEPITATIAGSTELAGTLLPCVNCHGADGRGRAEGGVVPSNVTWLELTKPYRAATINGRRRPAYDERSLRRAIAEGVDSAGNPLHPAMPRYAMSPEDLSDLVAYLKRVGRDEVPGVTDTEVRIGTIVPDSGPGAAIGEQMTAVLSAYFADAGEIHGRRVTLDIATLADLDAALASNPPFAFAGGLTAGSESRVAEAVESAAIPLVLPVSMRGEESSGNRQRFYLSPGIEEQIEALLRFSSARHPRVSRLIVIGNQESVGVARRAAERLETPPELATAASSELAELDDSTAVLFLDPRSTLARIPARGTSPLLFVGNLLPPDFFETAASYSDRIAVALTTTPGDLTAEGLAEYRRFAARHSIHGAHLASQLSAYAAAKVLVHALKQSGRELTRDSLRSALESLYEFETGVTPPLTFGRGRRIGSRRVHVAKIDAAGALVPAAILNIDD